MFFESQTAITKREDDLFSNTNNDSDDLDDENIHNVNDDHEIDRLKKPLLKTSSSFQRIKNNNYNFSLAKLNNFLLNESQLVVNEQVKLYGLFVITFDNKLGNVIEWKISNNLDLNQIEFKAMPSGIHSMDNDFIYFREKNLYGLAVFSCLKLNNELERNIRMKSIAILSNSFRHLHKYLDFLIFQVRKQLETPGQYDELIQFWNIYNTYNTFQPRNVNEISSTEIKLNLNLEILDNYHKTIQNSFNNFLNYFGLNIFLIWKYALLNKRILFYNNPPIGLNCLFTYCCFILKNTSYKLILDKQFLKPYFYINLHDINTIINESFYVAFTSEKIFETKSYLFDLYVNQKEFMYPSQFDTKNSTCSTNNKIIKITRMDEKRFKLLKNFKNSVNINRFGDVDSVFGGEEQIFINFFTELNDRLFGTLLEIENFNQQVTPEHMKAMNLDPIEDRDFLLQIIRFYDIKVKLVPKENFCWKN